MNQVDETYMGIALEEARKAVGRTSPNPAVGAVIVHKGKIIGKGYHKKAGTPHAEINALVSSAHKDTVGATMFVTLEPCSHTGRTPPCCEAIVKAGMAKVVIGMTDPNPVVNGRGIAFLEKHGIEVVSGVLEQQCKKINYPFIKYITTGLPWVIMKAGVSLDGKLNYQKGQSGWITGDNSGLEVHEIRDRVDAILVGRGTVAIDDPSLTTRCTYKKGKDPTRIILDSDLSLSHDAKTFHLESAAQTWVFCAHDADDQRKEMLSELPGVMVTPIERRGGRLDLKQLLQILGNSEICSLLVEGGAQVHAGFLRERLIDYAHLFYGPLFAGDQGISLLEGFSVQERKNAPRLKDIIYKQLGEDMLVSGRLQY